MKRAVLGAVAGVLLAGSVHAQGAHAGQDVQCTLCWFEKRSEGNTASVCEHARVPVQEIQNFFYTAGQRLGQAGVEEWSFECKTGEKKIKGKFEVEHAGENNNERN